MHNTSMPCIHSLPMSSTGALEYDVKAKHHGLGEFHTPLRDLPSKELKHDSFKTYSKPPEGLIKLRWENEHSD